MTSGLPQGPGSSSTGQGTEQRSGESITGRVGEALETARQGVTQGAQYIAEEARTLWTDTRSWVRRYPMEGLGIALGAGFLLGCCLTAFFSSSSGESSMRGMYRS
jgi:ElaB/YqjD/DUF883 family membrane-anchored ribosome-binding protein